MAEQETELSDKQKKEIAKWFLLNAPAGEIQYVAKDLKSVLNDDDVYDEAASEAFPVYNKSHMICLEMPGRFGDVLVTSYGELRDNEYLDSKTAQVAIVDHVKQVCTKVRPATDEELPSPYIEEYRCALEAEMLKYVGEAYPKGSCSVYCVNGKDAEGPGSDFELVVVISAARLSPQNFCNGSWRSIWNIEFVDDVQVLELKGKLQVGAHYFEEGNVQLDAKHECRDSTIFQRRPMLIISSVLYCLSGLVMLWSPNVYILLLGRLLDGFGVGLAVTLVPVYISETAPPEIRGLLNTLPQFTGSFGMFFSYCMVFGMSLTDLPNWRMMLGVLSIPSLVYFALTVFFLPESPRWLVSKGRMSEAKKVLQRLRGREDVAGEMALLVEGLGVGAETTIEEYIIGPANEDIEDQDISADKDQIKLYGPEQGLSWVARPVTGQSTLGAVSRHGSLVSQRSGLVDPLVTLFGSVHEKVPETGSMRSALFPHFGSMFSVGGNQARNEEWDDDIVPGDGEDYQSDGGGADSDDNLHSPLISRQTTSLDKDIVPAGHGSLTNLRHGSLMQSTTGEHVGSMGIGGGWQIAWQLSEKEGPDGKKQGGFKRIYLRQEGVPGSMRGSLVSLPGAEAPSDSEYVQAAALVSQPALYSTELMKQHPVGPAMVHPAETAKGSSWNDLFEPGVKHALAVGVGIQLLQQFSGINGVLYYTPQILEQAGVGVLLSNLGISSSSASLLISGITTLLMLPSIAVAMRLMDVAGRRSLLLTTIPVLIISLVVLVIGSLVEMGNVVHAAISTVSVVLYFCFFVMGFGPIPNILCAEIFPTRVRGLCIAICALTFWICDIIVTYSLPVLLKSVGLAGVFGMYAIVCVIAWVFVFIKVPETKGMPLEVITEFFSVGAKQASAAKNN